MCENYPNDDHALIRGIGIDFTMLFSHFGADASPQPREVHVLSQDGPRGRFKVHVDKWEGGDCVYQSLLLRVAHQMKIVWFFPPAKRSTAKAARLK